MGGYEFMSTLYENLLKATDNTDDITHEKYAVITKLENNTCSVKEERTGLEHHQVPIINGLNLKIGDVVVLGFVENSIYNVFVVGSITTEKQVYTKDEIDKIVQDIITGQIDLEGYMKWTDYTTDLNNTDDGEFLDGLDNMIQAMIGRGDL